MAVIDAYTLCRRAFSHVLSTLWRTVGPPGIQEVRFGQNRSKLADGQCSVDVDCHRPTIRIGGFATL
jgi:hypothetical protein